MKAQEAVADAVERVNGEVEQMRVESSVSDMPDSPPAGEPGSGGPGSEIGGDKTSDDFLRGIEEEFVDELAKNDPDLKRLREKRKESQNASGKEDRQGDTPPQDSDKDGKEGDDNAAPQDEKPVDEEGRETSEPVFDETVIPGLKAEHIKKIPDEALIAIADHVDATRTKEAELKAKQEELDNLLSDPVIRSRRDMLESGKPQYAIRDISISELKKVGDELGLDDGEIEKLIPTIREIIKDRVVDAANQQVAETDKKKQVEDSIKKGQALFGNEINALLPKELRIKEKSFDKLLTEGSKHPEWKIAEKGLLKIQQYCVDRGITYWDLTHPESKSYMTPEELYAAAAARMKMPVAMNTSDRDKKMIGDAVQKRLAVFYKGRDGAARTLDVSNQSGGNESAGKIVVDSGYDVVKLATDGSYLESSIQQKPGDMEHLRLISALRAKGERIAQQRNGRSK
jgi:hypothetical protein